MSKILNSIWYTPIGTTDCIWIVKVDTGFWIKFYIGNATGKNQEEDEQHIAKMWAPVFTDSLIKLFEHDIQE